jgi:hypothetical protein
MSNSSTALSSVYSYVVSELREMVCICSFWTRKDIGVSEVNNNQSYRYQGFSNRKLGSKQYQEAVRQNSDFSVTGIMSFIVSVPLTFSP